MIYYHAPPPSPCSAWLPEGEGICELPRVPPVLEETGVCQVSEVRLNLLSLLSFPLFLLSSIPSSLPPSLQPSLPPGILSVSTFFSSSNQITSVGSWRMHSVRSSLRSSSCNTGTCTRRRGRSFSREFVSGVGRAGEGVKGREWRSEGERVEEKVDR